MTITKIKNTARKTAIGMPKTALLPYLKDLFGEQAEITYKETSKGIPTEVWVWLPTHHQGIHPFTHSEAHAKSIGPSLMSLGEFGPAGRQGMAF